MRHQVLKVIRDSRRGAVRWDSVMALSCFVALCLGLCLSLVPDVATRALEREEGGMEQEGARVVTTYLLKEDSWAVFRVPLKGGPLKVVLSANVAAECFENPNLAASFCLHYQLLGGGDVILREQRHVIREKPAVSGRGEFGSRCEYYLDASLRPLGSKSVYVNPEGLPEAAEKLRLRLSWMESVIKDVCARVYYKESPQPYKLRYLWQRLSSERQERLARANVYGADLLTEFEKRNLLENRWVAIGPQGISRRDYWERKLYSVDVGADISGGDVGMPMGLHVEAENVGVIQLPEGGGCIRLECEPCDSMPVETGGLLTWYGPGVSERFDATFPLGPGASSVRHEFDAGLLEISASRNIVVRAFLEGAGPDVEITPAPECVPGYRLSTGRPVEFSNGGASESVTPLRFDVRRVSPDGSEPASRERTVYYALLSEHNEIIQAGHLAHDQPISLYDSVVAGLLGRRISDPTRFYFALPLNCGFVRIWGSDEDLVITGYTRPGALPRQVSVPEEQTTFERRDEEFRDWFLVRPQNYVDCLRTLGEVYVRVQSRPRRVAQEIWEGDYHVEIHEPEGPARAYKIVTQVGERLPSRESLFSAYFQKLEIDTPCRLEFIGRPGDLHAWPKAILFKETSLPCSLEVLLDGEVSFSGLIASKSGEIELEAVQIGQHHVEIKSGEPLLFYMNSLRTPANERFVERLVWVLDQQDLTFKLERQEEGEVVLWFRVYQRAYAESGVELRVTVRESKKKLGVPLDSWTFTSVKYSVRPGGGEMIPVLGNERIVLCGGDTFYFKVGPDVEGEELDLHVALTGGAECFVQVGHVVAGARESIRPAFENR